MRLAAATFLLLLILPSVAAARNRSRARLRQRVVRLARSQLGVPYVWGAEDPGRAFDCSGLVQWLYRKIGVRLPRTTWFQLRRGMRVKRWQLERGDLIFYDGGAHVAVYMGDGLVEEAPHSGAVVRIRTMGRFFQARRVL